LREQPLWQLLAANQSAVVLAVLRAAFAEGAPALPGTLLHERVGRELDLLRAAGEDLPQAARLYVADWLRQGWLVRRLPAAAAEETYEPSAEAAAALRFVGGFMAPEAATAANRPTSEFARTPPDLGPQDRAGSAPPGAREMSASGMEARQLDIFADSGDVVRRNAFAEAVLAEDLPMARAAMQAWKAEWPDDRLLASGAALLAHLPATSDAPAGSGLAAEAVAAAADTLDGVVGPAAAALLGEDASPWMAKQWCALATQARNVAWRAELARVHPTALFLRGGQWGSAAQAVTSIPSWRRIPQPLLWMAEASWRNQGADAAWPLLAEAFWLAPARARALLASLAGSRLRAAMARFESDFELQDEDDWAWWPAWLAVDQPLLAEILGLGEDAPERTAANGFRLVASLLRLEREGRHHDLVAARKRLQSLEPRLFACYMRTR
jgi:hypothetical protein